MNIKVNFYGVLAEVTGQSQLAIAGTPDLEALREKLFAMYPALKKYSFRTCIGQTFSNTNVALAEGNTVSLLPPFSGG